MLLAVFVIVTTFSSSFPLIKGSLDVSKLPKFERIIGFWPLNEESGRLGYYYNGAMMLPVGGLSQLLQGSGPFRAGAYSVYANNNSIASYPYNLTNPTSFTISFYFRAATSVKNQTGIFTTQASFDLYYQPPTVADNKGYILMHGVGSVLLAPYEPGQWMFCAFSYAAATKELTIYYQTASGSAIFLSKVTLISPIPRTGDKARVEIGAAAAMGMSPQSELSCISLHSVVLSSKEVEEMRWACRTADATKLPPDEPILLGIWPFSDKTDCCIGYHGNGAVMPPASTGALLSIRGGGPFKEGSFKTSSPGRYFARYFLLSPQSFTISLHFLLAEMPIRRVGLFSVDDNFGIFYTPPKEEGGNGSISIIGEGARDAIVIAPYRSSDVGIWFFLACSYSFTTKTLKAYYQSTSFMTLRMAEFKYSIIKEGDITTATIGLVSYNGNNFIGVNNEISCVNLYSAALDQRKVEDLRYSCRAPQQLTLNVTLVEKVPQRDFLVGLWPLDSQARLTGYVSNMAPTNPVIKDPAARFIKTGGPFGGGSFSGSSNNRSSIASYQMAGGNPSSFTLSLFFKSNATSPRGIITLKNSLSLYYHPITPNEAEIGVIPYGGSAWLKQVFFFARHTAPRVGRWMFLALSFDENTSSLVTYHQFHPFNYSKLTVAASTPFPIKKYPDHPAIVDIGAGIDGNNWLYMGRNDEIAFVTLHSKILDQQQAETLRWARGDENDVVEEDTSENTSAQDKNSKRISSLVPRAPVRAEFLENSADVMKRCNHFDVNRATPPLGYRGRSLPITIAFQINALREISNLDEVVAVNAILLSKWRVDTCPWNSSSVVTDRIQEEMQVVSPKLIWLPSMRFTTAAQANVYMKRVAVGDDFLVTMQTSPRAVNRTFNFYWTREGAFNAICYLSLEMFPFDTQTCTFEFTLQRERSLITFSENDIYFYIADGATGNTEWNVVSMAHNVSWQTFNGFEVSSARFTVTFRRIPTYYLQNLFVPVAVLGILVLAGFAIPPVDSTRSAFTVTIVLTLTVAQAAVLGQIPKKPYVTMLGSYVAMITWFAVGCLVYELISLMIAASIFGGKPPKCGKGISVVRVLDMAAFVAAIIAFVVIHVVFMVYI